MTKFTRFTGAMGLAAVAALRAGTAVAQDAADTSAEEQLFALEDTLSAQTSVASSQASTLREAPAVLTLITHEEIERQGSRDLVDVLRRVPGLDVELDVDGVTSLGIRGLWGQEGKILVLVDGQELNEPFYGTLQLWNHVPVELIKSIEIIRGPGSALYGGHAELAVINITLFGAERQGVAVSGNYGEMMDGTDFGSDYARRGGSVAFGRRWGDSVGAWGSVSLGQANRSDRIYQDFGGAHFPMEGNNTSQPLFVDLGADVHGAKAHVIYDAYRTTTRDGSAQALLTPQRKDFDTLLADLSYDWKPSEAFHLAPRLAFHESQPWRNTDPGSPVFYDLSAQRYTAQVTAGYTARTDLSVSGGVVGTFDHVRPNQPAANVFAPFGFRDYQNFALFGEGQYTGWVNVDVGARFEVHSQFGASFVPRVALTKLVNRFHVKLLASGAFRTPDLQDLADNLQLRPERTWVEEVEAGYQFNPNLFLSANIFNTQVIGPIVYYRTDFDPSGNYFNAQQMGSRGVEADFRASYPWGSADINYSFYHSTNELPDYRVPGNSSLALAFPAHKLVATATLPVWRSLTVAPSLVLLSRRYGYTTASATGAPMLGSEPTSALVNVQLTYKDLGTKGFDVGLGLYNLFDTSFRYVQAYNAGHPPLPDTSREVFLRLSYALGW